MYSEKATKSSKKLFLNLPSDVKIVLVAFSYINPFSYFFVTLDLSIPNINFKNVNEVVRLILFFQGKLYRSVI